MEDNQENADCPLGAWHCIKQGVPLTWLSKIRFVNALKALCIDCSCKQNSPYVFNVIVNQQKEPKQPLSALLKVINDFSSWTKYFNLKKQVSNTTFIMDFICVWIMTLSCNFLREGKKSLIHANGMKHRFILSHFLFHFSLCHFKDWRWYTQKHFNM